MKTREELVLRALAEHGIPGAGQTASAEDYAAMDDDVEPVMADLAQRDVWVWGDPDEIDEAAFIHLAEILANSRAGDFGAPKDDDKRKIAEKRLRALAPNPTSGQPQTTEYF